MNLPLFISGRYLFARKSHNVINLISAVSAIGMAIGTAALVIILSVYNGFDKIIKDNISDLDPDLKVVASRGKSFVPEGKAFDAIYAMPSIVSICSVVEENVFISYGSYQSTALAKGVDLAFESESRLREHLVAGEFTLHHGEMPLACVGAGMAQRMGMHPRFRGKIEIWFPDRESKVSLSNPAASLRKVEARPSGIFSVSNETDGKLLILPIETMRQLLGYESEVSSIELRTSPGTDLRGLEKELRAILPDGLEILDRYRQNPVLYKMMRYEKAAIYLILLFVVVIIAFSVFGAISMLMIEKKEDIATLRAMGAGPTLTRSIFVLEAWLTSLLGMVAGLIIGLTLALLQQHFGFVKMPGNFLVSAYPVQTAFSDILAITLGVALAGYVIARLSVHYNTHETVSD